MGQAAVSSFYFILPAAAEKPPGLRLQSVFAIRGARVLI